MNIFAGLEKFGLKVENKSLFEEEKKAQTKEAGAPTEEAPTEESFLLEKALRCPVCDKVFKTKMIKNGRTKRLEPDDDLRPRFEYIDTIKYDVASCPSCGYAAMNRYFEHLTAGQIKLVQEGVCANYKPSADTAEKATYDYDTALDRYKLALFNTIVKRGKTSERAYTCLKIAWLYRGKAETLDKADPKYAEVFKECKEQEEAFYEQAYEGFTKAISKEMFPMCGMDQCTVDYLLAVMSFHFKKFDVASKCISRIQSAPSASKRMKDKACDLKERIVTQMKQSK